MIGLSVLAGGFIMFSMPLDSAKRPEAKEIQRYMDTPEVGTCFNH